MKQQANEWFKRNLEKTQLTDGYKIEDTVDSVARRFGIDSRKILKLNSNENFFISRERLVGFMREVLDEYDLRIYPQEEGYTLREKLGEHLNVQADSIVIGNGSDELIDLIMRLFLEKGDQIVSITPTFSMYKQRASFLGAEYFEVPLKRDFSLDKQKILSDITPKTKLLFLCSPNNPTANQFGIDDVRFLAKEFPGIVVIDEAYAEFAGYSALPLLNEFENLIILRTFSKAFGLAGLRIGYSVSNSDIAGALSKKAQLPYSVSPVALRMGLKILGKMEIVEETVKQTKLEREALIKNLNQIVGVEAFKSQTNFVFFRTDKRSNEIYQGLLKRGILLKKLDRTLHLDNCFRVTVGPKEMSLKFLEALKEIMVKDR